MTILVYADHDNNALKSATLSAITAAATLGNDIHLLVAGKDCQSVAKQASKINQINKVIVADNDAFAHQLAENIASLVTSIASQYRYIIAAATTTGKNFLPRVAALLDVGMISDITAIVDGTTFVRPIYAGNANETVQTSDEKIVLSVRATAFDAATYGDDTATIEPLDKSYDSQKSHFMNEELAKADRPELTSAKVVVSGGRALASGENFEQYINPLADKLGAAIGASRAAVDAGFVPNDLQVGQTGKIVAPELYIAVGISGAIQHLAGMKDSKTIVAINNDPESPIVQIADYYLEGDLFEVLPELTAKL